MNDAMKKHLLEAIVKSHGIKACYMFGSQKDAGRAFLEGSPYPVEKHADLDVGVIFGRPPPKAFEAYGDLYAALSIFFEPFTIDLVFLEETSALFQYEAIQGDLVYCEDEVFLDE